MSYHCAPVRIFSVPSNCTPLLVSMQNTETMQMQLDTEKPTGSSPIQNCTREAKMQAVGSFKSFPLIGTKFIHFGFHLAKILDSYYNPDYCKNIYSK